MTLCTDKAKSIRDQGDILFVDAILLILFDWQS